MATTEKEIYYPTDYSKVADVPSDLKKLAESVDTAIGNIPEYDDTDVKDDIRDLKEKDEQQDKDIESLQTKQTELETEIQELNQDIQSNAIIEETEQAKSLYIEDANSSRGSLTVEGNAEQETRSGINRCNRVIGGLPKTYVSPATSYVATNAHFDDKFVEKWKENGFTLKVKAKNSLTKGAFTRFILDETWNKRLAYSAFSKRTKDEYNIYEAYVSDTDYTLFSDKRFIIAWEDTTEQTGCDLYAIEIDLGNTVGQDLEDYGEMPSSQYLSEFNALEAGSTEIKKLGKNIMPINNLGTTWKYTEKGIKNLGRSTGSRIGYVKVKKGQTVKFGLILFSKPSATTSFSLMSKTESNINISSNFSNFNSYELNTKYERTFTAEEDIEVSFAMYGNENSEIFEFQLWAEYDALTEYEQYKEEVYSLDIQQDMFLGDNFNLNTKKEVHFWKEIELDGTESLSYAAGSVAPFQLAIQDFDFPKSQADMPNIRSNQYSARSWSGGLSTDIRDYLVTTPNQEGSTGTPVIRFKDSDCSTLEEFKAKLAQQKTAGTPVKLYYKSTQKTELDLTDAQIEVLEKLSKLRFYKGVNNIFTTEDIALLQAKYSVDLKSKNNKMQQEIDEIKELLSTTQTSAMLLNNLEQDLIEEVK